MENKGKPTYAGSIGNCGAQTVDALFKNNKGGKPVVQKDGTDLRAKPSATKG